MSQLAQAGEGDRRAHGLRIGYLIQDFFPEVGAGPARALEMSRYWEASGARVTILTGMPNRRIPGRGDGAVDMLYRGRWFLREQYEGIETQRSWLYASNRRGFKQTLMNNASFTVSSFLHAAARRPPIDILIASSPPFLPLLSGVAISRWLGIPLIIELRDLWPDYLEQMGMIKSRAVLNRLFALERWLLQRAEHTVVVTESFRQRVVRKEVPENQVSVISNGVDLSAYAPSTFGAAGLKPNATDEFLVGYLGTFGRGQSLPTIIEAAAIVAQRDRRIRFLLVGDGPDGPALMEAVGRLGVQNVEVLAPIPREQTRAFYSRCDVCLVPLAPTPIFQETVPSKLFEIMACERPLIASMLGEGARIVNESGAGVQIEPGNALALAEAVLAMRATPRSARESMGQRGRRYVAQHYDRRTLAARYLELMTQIHISRSRSRALQ